MKWILVSELWNKAKAMRMPLVLQDWKAAVYPIESETGHSGFFGYYSQSHRYPLGGRPWRERTKLDQADGHSVVRLVT